MNHRPAWPQWKKRIAHPAATTAREAYLGAAIFILIVARLGRRSAALPAAPDKFAGSSPAPICRRRERSSFQARRIPLDRRF